MAQINGFYSFPMLLWKIICSLNTHYFFPSSTYFLHTPSIVFGFIVEAKSGGCPDRALIPTPLSVIFPTLPGDGGKLDTLGLSAGAWNTVYLSCWGMRDGFQLMVRKGQKNRETTNRKKRDGKKKKREKPAKRVGWVSFLNEGGEGLDFQETAEAWTLKAARRAWITCFGSLRSSNVTAWSQASRVLDRVCCSRSLLIW